MQITPVKTPVIYPKKQSLATIISTAVPAIADKSIIVISSKIVSLCEGSYISPQKITKDELIKKNSQLYIDRNKSMYKTMLTITKNSLMLAAGIDESNSNGMYVTWPQNPLKSAKDIYTHLSQIHKNISFGILIVDSTSRPLRLGTIGTAIAHYGFSEINDYRGTKDLFDHTMTISRSNVAEGLASAAVLAMGEGTEQTPLAVITDIPFALFGTEFSGSCYLNQEDAYRYDVYEPIWNSVDWQKGVNNLRP